MATGLGVEKIGVFGLIGRRLLAWRTRHVATAELAILEARRRVAEAQRATEEAETELQLRTTLKTVSGEQGVELLAPQTEIERLLLERERLRRQRLQQALVGSGSVQAALPESIEWEISDREIETLAVKAVSHFGSLPPAEAQQAWATWRRELELKLPPYAATEVARRVEQLRQMVR